MEFITIIYIGICFLAGSLATDQQSFRRTPEDADVVAGQNVTLPCRVDNQRGQAQWTQNGFALGFNRSIPGFPRYEMIGDANNGVHDLRILHANLSDDGEYQCQVTPMVPSQGIRHEVKITILLPPVSVEMVGITHGKMTVRSGSDFTLTCLTTESKPEPSIEWYKGDQKLLLDQEDKTEPSDLDRRVNFRSVIKLTAHSDDNNAIYKCKVIHPALGSSMAAKVRLDVLYEPGEAVILGYNDGEIVRAGELKTLKCRARGGNPLPEIFWYKNGLQVDTTFNKYPTYTINEYTMTISSSDNNAKYECHVQNTMTDQPKKAAFHMRVNFPPSDVQILSPDEVNLGDVISITCEAKNSNPPADVSMVINGVSPGAIATKHIKTEDGGFTTIANLTGYQLSPDQVADLVVNCYAVNQPLGNTSLASKTITVLRPPGTPIIFGVGPQEQLRQGINRRLTCQSQGGNPLPTLTWHKNDQVLVTHTRKERGNSISYLDVNPDRTDNGALYKCVAENSAITPDQAPYNTIELNVTYPASYVNVTVNPPSPREGDIVQITCRTAPAYPAANISLWSGIDPLLGDYGPSENGSYGGLITTYSKAINATREFNQKVYTCKADNGFTSSTHGAVTLQVHFAPQITTLEESVTVDEYANVQIPTQVDANPTPVTYTWWKGTDVIMHGPVLNITSATRQISGTYTLEVENAVGSTKKNVTVNVKFAPIITDVVERREVIAGHDTTLECHFEGSPAPTVEWKRQDRDLGTKKVSESTYPNKGVLKIHNVTAEDTGFFTCIVRNEVAETNISKIALVVNQPPTPDPSPKYYKAAAELGGNARLTCRVQASPEPTFMWFTRRSEPISEDVHKRYEVLPYEIKDGLNTYESVLLVKGVEPKDHGHFTCQVRNLLGLESITVTLEGTSKPDPPEELRILNTTHNSVHVGWIPGFDGGLEQSFRVRYHIANSKHPLYMDVYPSNATSYWIPDLLLGKTYAIAVVAINAKGESNPSAVIRSTTQSEAPLGSLSPGVPSERGHVPALVILIISLVGICILVLNAAILACCIRKRAKTKRLSGSPPLTDIEIAISRVLASKADVPKLVTLVGSAIGVLLLTVNIALVACYLQKRKKTNKDSTASSDKSSTKATTLELYATSSFAGTVTGETLSSTSQKSRESYAPEHDSADDYDVDSTRLAPTNTYLIEQLDPPPQYATRAPPHILPPPPTHNMDDPYGDNMRRNQYNSGLAPSYGTLGRRGNPTLGQDHYNISNADSYPRYNYVPPSVPQNLPQYNGSLRRNQQGKLHFPKDYIRNGAMSSPNGTPTLSPTKGFDSTFSSPIVQSPIRSTNPSLSTFAPDVAASSIPMEQRGHLV